MTLEGDLFDPAGTLTGGTRAPTSSSILTRFGQPTRSPWVALTLGAGDLLDKKEELEQREKKLKALKAQVKTPCESILPLLTAKSRRRRPGSRRSSTRTSRRSSLLPSTSHPSLSLDSRPTPTSRSSDVSMASQPLDHSHQAAEELRSMEEEVNAG